MAVITIGSTWSNGDQLTPAALNAKWTGATFASGAVDGSTTALSGGAIIVKDLGVDTSQLASNAVETAKINALAVTGAKIAAATITNAKMAADSVAGSGTGASGTNVIEAASIGHADLNDDIISDQAQTLAAIPDDTDELLISDAGALKNIAYGDLVTNSPLIPAAYGRVLYTSSGTQTVTGYNVDSPATATGDQRQVDFTTALPDATYIVVATMEDTGGTAGRVNVRARAAGSVTFESADDDGADRAIHFVVYHPTAR